MHFVKDESDLVEKFALFDPLHIGEYGTRIRNDDGNGHHYTFVGLLVLSLETNIQATGILVTHVFSLKWVDNLII